MGMENPQKHLIPPTVVRIKRKNGQMVVRCDLYIGRACFRGGWKLRQSKWHNPFSVQQMGSAELACEKYRRYIMDTPKLLEALPELSGLALGCWCETKTCHGHVLRELFIEFM